MNTNSFIAALLIMLTGLGLAFLISLAILDDLRFIACATPTTVRISNLDVQFKRVSDPVHALSSVEASVVLTVERGGQSVLLSETVTASESTIRQRVEALQSRVGQRSDLLLCERFPTRFALERPVPWKGLAALLAAIVILVLPAGGAMIHYLKSRGQRGA